MKQRILIRMALHPLRPSNEVFKKQSKAVSVLKARNRLTK